MKLININSTPKITHTTNGNRVTVPLVYFLSVSTKSLGVDDSLALVFVSESRLVQRKWTLLNPLADCVRCLKA